MDSIGDYFYLIVVVIAAIGSIFKNKKKDKTVIPKPSSTEDEDFGDVLKEIFGEKPKKKPEVAYEKPTSSTKKTQFDTILSFDNTSDISKLKAKKEVTKTIVPKTHIIVTTEEVVKPKYSINNVDEARAAFISAEIFNRRY